MTSGDGLRDGWCQQPCVKTTCIDWRWGGSLHGACGGGRSKRRKRKFLPYVLVSSRGRFHRHMPDGMLPESVRIFFSLFFMRSALSDGQPALTGLAWMSAVKSAWSEISCIFFLQKKKGARKSSLVLRHVQMEAVTSQSSFSSGWV